MMQMLIDVEMKMFKGLDVRAIFLQNIITDLVLDMILKKSSKCTAIISGRNTKYYQGL